MNEPICLSFFHTGVPAEVLELHSMPMPVPGEGEVLVRMLAAPVNPADLNTVEGTYGIKLELPATPGVEGFGEVLESRTSAFVPGDRVIFLKRAATWASHTVVSADALFKVPAAIDPLQAAMLKVNPATAWQLLRGVEPLETGDWIVQNLGNSAVGRCVIQLAKKLGIRTVSFVRNPSQIPELLTLGADAVFVDDEDGMLAAKEVMSGAKARLAFNAVGGDSALRLMKLLAEGGTHITYGAMGRKPLTIPNGPLIFRDIRVRGLWVTRWADKAPAEELHTVYQELARLVCEGVIVQPVDSTYPLAEFMTALERISAPDRSGKVLFRMG
jgi:NADPH:quinone reductase-like Zn-dependent oxidoreductase